MISNDDHNEEYDSEEEERERYRELLEELRTIIPGAQVLLAFLLTVPFATRFSEIDRVGKIVFAVSLVTVAMGTILFLSPAAYHRLSRERDRRGRLRFGVRTTLIGMFLLAVSIVSAIFVVVRFLYNTTLGGAIAAAIALVAITMWYVLPLYYRQRSQEEETRANSK